MKRNDYRFRVKLLVGAVGKRSQCACRELRKDWIATEDVRRTTGGSREDLSLVDTNK